jgi:hypothetical protein
VILSELFTLAGRGTLVLIGLQQAWREHLQEIAAEPVPTRRKTLAGTCRQVRES